jgi:hypothetical protein
MTEHADPQRAHMGTASSSGQVRRANPATTRRTIALAAKQGCTCEPDVLSDGRDGSVLVQHAPLCRVARLNPSSPSGAWSPPW